MRVPWKKLWKKFWKLLNKMFNIMFSNIGRKIKILAKVMCVLGMSAEP